jgi:hypothetical protein
LVGITLVFWTVWVVFGFVEEDIVGVPAVDVVDEMDDGLNPLKSSCESCGNRLREFVTMMFEAGDVSEVVAVLTKGTFWVLEVVDELAVWRLFWVDEVVAWGIVVEGEVATFEVVATPLVLTVAVIELGLVIVEVFCTDGCVGWFTIKGVNTPLRVAPVFWAGDVVAVFVLSLLLVFDDAEIVVGLVSVWVFDEVMQIPFALNDVHGLLLTMKPTVLEANWTQYVVICMKPGLQVSVENVSLRVSVNKSRSRMYFSIFIVIIS